MNILFVTDTKVPHLGGKSSHILDLKDGLIATDHSAFIISASSVPDKIKRREKIKKAFILPIKLIDKWTYSRKSLYITDLSIQKLVRDYIKENEIDLIAAQDPISAILSYEIVGDEIPVTLTMHSYFGKGMSDVSADEKAKKHFDIIKERDLKCINTVKAIIGVDTRIKEDCESFTKTIKPELQVYSIPNFVNTDKFCPVTSEQKQEARKSLNIPENVKVAICIRRLCDKNGVIYAIKSMEKIENTLLLVGGDGPNMGELKKYVADHKLENKVRLLGGVDGEIKTNIYAAADYALVPSITVNGLQEATSISAIEAMACGHVLIASEIGGLKELVNNEHNGILVNEQSAEEISEAINKLNNDDCLCKQLSKNARRTVLENYSHIAGANKYMSVFSEALK